MVAQAASGAGWNDRNDDQSNSSRDTSYVGSYAGATSSGDSSWQPLSSSSRQRQSNPMFEADHMSVSSLVVPSTSSSLSPTESRYDREMPAPSTSLVHPPSNALAPSSRSDWFSCPSIAHNLDIHNGAVPRREIKLSLVMVQQPQHTLAAGNGVMAHKYGRANPVDPPPICQLLTQNPEDNIYLQHPEVSVRAHLVQANSPHAEIPQDSHREAQLINGIHESPFVAPVTSTQLQSLFLFTELGVRCPGRFRLRFDLYDRVGISFRKLTCIYTDVFEVHDTRRSFPGLQRSSDLMRAIVARGLKVRITDSQPSRSIKRRKMPEGGVVVVSEMPTMQQSARAPAPDYPQRQPVQPPPLAEGPPMMPAWRTLPHPSSLPSAYQAHGKTSWALPSAASARSSAQHAAPRLSEQAEIARVSAWREHDRAGYAERPNWQSQQRPASPYAQSGQQHHGLPGVEGAPQASWPSEGSRAVQGLPMYPRRSTIHSGSSSSTSFQHRHPYSNDASHSRPRMDDMLRGRRLPPLTSWIPPSSARTSPNATYAPSVPWNSQPALSSSSSPSQAGPSSHSSRDPFIPPTREPTREPQPPPPPTRDQQHRGG